MTILEITIDNTRTHDVSQRSDTDTDERVNRDLADNARQSLGTQNCWAVI